MQIESSFSNPASPETNSSALLIGSNLLSTVLVAFRIKSNTSTNSYSLFLHEQVTSFLNNETNSPIYNFRMDGQTGYLDYQKNQVLVYLRKLKLNTIGI